MGARVTCGWQLCCVLVSAAIVSAFAEDTGAACTKGDTPCFCKAIGGTWKALQSPLLPACKVTYQHQGQERYVHVYLPPAFDGTTQWPIWVHLHGVFWATMGDIGARVGKPVNGTDIIPAFDHSVEILGDKAILVYPQSTGEAGMGTPDEGQGKKYRQFWRIPFWRCSVGICRDPSIDDMGFIEKVVVDLPKRLPLKPNHYLLTGESAGGMMVHAILCQSKVIPGMVDAAIDMLGGIGADFARGPECAGAKPVPFLKLHGIEDPFITYSKDILVDGVNFASSIEGTQIRARANGCGPDDSGKKDVPEADGKMLCTDFCGGAPDKLPAKLCGMPTVGHDTDHPHPGFVYEQSWAWFQDQAKAAAGRKPAGVKASPAKPNATTAQTASAEEPLVMNITFPGAKAEDFKGSKGAAALGVVSNVTGLPADNITATYHQASSSSSKGGSRRLQRHLSEAPVDAVTGRYALKTAQPAKVTEAVKAAIKDGSLLQTLQQKALTPAAGASGDKAGPLVSLASPAGAAGASGVQKVLLKPTDLAKVAARKQAPKNTAATSKKAAEQATVEEDTLDELEEPTAAVAAGPVADAAPAAAAAAAQSSDGSSSSSSPSTGTIVGAVLGAVGGAALLAGGAYWATAAARQRKQQQQQDVPASSKDWQQQQQRPGVINLNADAAMYIAEEPSSHTK